MSNGKKYSSFLKEQKIFDNWRSYLTEGFSGYAPSKFDPKVTRQGFQRPEYRGMNGYGGNPGYAEEDTIVDEEMEPVRAFMKKGLEELAEHLKDSETRGPGCVDQEYIEWMLGKAGEMMGKISAQNNGEIGGAYTLSSQNARKLSFAAIGKTGGGQVQYAVDTCPQSRRLDPENIDRLINKMTRLLLQDFEGWLESNITGGQEYATKDLGRRKIQDIIKELLNKENQNEQAKKE